MRLILERSDAGLDLTPGEIADHLSISPASVSGILDRLHAGGLITFSPNEKDRRSKLVIPVDRSVDIEHIDPLTARIRDMSAGLSSDDVRLIAEFIEGIADAVDGECR
ncbi:MarR family transcriptional regulator [Microbacterium limosum]|uniref:MarR family transcriptional regulator n=1 Tax=Microbacterium limosum TaxID=3079935 RepID=A0AAU0MKE1_9MICO|nr:MarR family transcriptional regulator [Microbacterium sp. Y20]WOQ70217.1 MarR family transcriptional regulator [Microbacterium sp. Y20]